MLNLFKNKIPQKKKIINKEIKINFDKELNNVIINILKQSGLPIISEENNIKK